jgi:hypothetical protein
MAERRELDAFFGGRFEGGGVGQLGTVVFARRTTALAIAASFAVAAAEAATRRRRAGLVTGLWWTAGAEAGPALGRTAGTATTTLAHRAEHLGELVGVQLAVGVGVEFIEQRQRLAARRTGRVARTITAGAIPVRTVSLRTISAGASTPASAAVPTGSVIAGTIGFRRRTLRSRFAGRELARRAGTIPARAIAALATSPTALRHALAQRASQRLHEATGLSKLVVVELAIVIVVELLHDFGAGRAAGAFAWRGPWGSVFLGGDNRRQ